MSRPDDTDGREYVGQLCTLDGQRAIISGRRLPFARVSTLPDGAGCEWAWAHVARIMRDHGGAFHS